MLDAIPNVVYTFANVFKIVYILCLWVGWAITTAIVETVKGIIAVTSNLLMGLAILSEDFLHFLEDLGELTEKLVLGFVDTLCTTFESIFDLSGLIVFGISSIPNLLCQMVMSIKIGTHVVNFVVLVKDAVLLLGICIWEAFALLFVGLSYLNHAPYVLFFLVARAADKLLVDVLSTMETYWFRSICGLSLGYGIYLVAKSTGVLPEGSFVQLLGLLSKHVCCHSKTTGLVVLTQSLRILHLLKSVVNLVLGFFWRQTESLKTCAAGVVREAISHTPTKAALQIKLEKEKASTQCVVCMDKRRDVMILNCRHLLMCRQCAVTVAVSTGACPVCRSPIENIISVYT
uniref:Putative E3 ubiquitin-protein ligase MGRN1 n=1 Tax=Lygus hesperus TaxID=30085 RepID=A0A0A9Y7N6_LYGHE